MRSTPKKGAGMKGRLTADREEWERGAAGRGSPSVCSGDVC